MDIINKAQGWAAQYASILTASAETQFPWLYKGAVGGLEHVISVDNGGSYMELWRDGSGSYYATTGAAVKQMPGLAKGAKLDVALDKFFSLTAKLSKGGSVRSDGDHGHPPKFHNTRGTNSPAFHSDTPGHTHPRVGEEGYNSGRKGITPAPAQKAAPDSRKAVRKAYGDVPKGGWSEDTKAWGRAYANPPKPPKGKPVKKADDYHEHPEATRRETHAHGGSMHTHPIPASGAKWVSYAAPKKTVKKAAPKEVHHGHSVKPEPGSLKMYETAHGHMGGDKNHEHAGMTGSFPKGKPVKKGKTQNERQLDVWAKIEANPSCGGFPCKHGPNQPHSSTPVKKGKAVRKNIIQNVGSLQKAFWERVGL